MKKSQILSILLVSTLISCGEGSSSSPSPLPLPPVPQINDRTSILGAWDVVRTGCEAYITFGNPFADGRSPSQAVSGAPGSSFSANFVSSIYVFTPSSTRSQLDFNFLSDNQFPDCDGFISDLTGENLTVFVAFDGDNMQWFATEQGGEPIENFVFNSEAATEQINLTNDPDFDITNITITPNPVTTGAFTQMMASVDYTISDSNGATIRLGFNEIFINTPLSPRTGEHIVQVAEGSGQVDLFLDVDTVPDWGLDAGFQAFITVTSSTNSVVNITRSDVIDQQ